MTSNPAPAVSLRALAPGDIEWVIARHDVLYRDEFGWNHEFGELVAEILHTLDKHHGQGWIAWRDGQRVGSVFLTRRSEQIGQLRCLLVEPSARGAGVGHALVAQCISAARAAGYRKLALWTNGELESAARLYAAHGFRQVSSKREMLFGAEREAQEWELEL